MIILEGPDGSGKTTLIEALGYERRSFKALRGGTGADARGNWGGQDPAPIAYARQVLAAHARVAFDRFHLSETIYGPILRDGSSISDEEVTVLERLLTARGVTTVLCLPSGMACLRNVMREGRERPAYQTLGFLRQAYLAWEALGATTLYDYRVDYEHVDDPASALGAVLRMSRPTCPPGVVGSPTATFLFVGERSNDGVDLPFFTMDGCSGFLNRSLWYAGFEEGDMAFTNALASDGRQRDLRAALLASTTAVITLGTTAREIADDQDLPVPVYQLPHPQFWKRFHYRQPDVYADHLKEIRISAS